MRKEKLAIQKGYFIDELGNVFSKSGKLRKLRENSSGYLRFNIKYNSKNLGIYAHRLQAYQKYGEALYSEGIVVRHLNGNPIDNCFNNIAIGSSSDNAMDIPIQVRMSRSIKGAKVQIKYDYKEIRRYHSLNGNSYKETMKYFNISSKGTLHYILKERRYNK